MPFGGQRTKAPPWCVGRYGGTTAYLWVECRSSAAQAQKPVAERPCPPFRASPGGYRRLNPRFTNTEHMTHTGLSPHQGDTRREKTATLRLNLKVGSRVRTPRRPAAAVKSKSKSNWVCGRLRGLLCFAYVGDLSKRTRTLSRRLTCLDRRHQRTRLDAG